jgi:hypothetical protein
MATDPRPPRYVEQGRADDGYKPLQLIGVILLALLGFAVFFLSFLLAPLAILLLFYVGFSSADRSKRGQGNGNGNGNGHAEEAPVEAVQPTEPLAPPAPVYAPAPSSTYPPPNVTPAPPSAYGPAGIPVSPTPPAPRPGLSSTPGAPRP